MASVAIADLPERLRRGAGRTPQPIALLARLGVDERHEGQGLAAACWCMPNLSRHPPDPLHLLLLLKDIRRTLGLLPR